MEQNHDESKLLKWLKAKPDLVEKLDHMRLLEERDGNLDVVELELLELVKGMGADSYRRVLEQKEATALSRQRSESGGRIHGKKN